MSVTRKRGVSLSRNYNSHQQIFACFARPDSWPISQEAFAKAAHLEIQAKRCGHRTIPRGADSGKAEAVKSVEAGDLRTRIIDKLVEKQRGCLLPFSCIHGFGNSLTGFRFLLAELHLESLKTKTDVKALRKA